MHMKRSYSISLSFLFVSIFLLNSCVGEKNKLDIYQKEENIEVDTLRPESIKIQTH